MRIEETVHTESITVRLSLNEIDTLINHAIRVKFICQAKLEDFDSDKAYYGSEMLKAVTMIIKLSMLKQCIIDIDYKADSSFLKESEVSNEF